MPVSTKGIFMKTSTEDPLIGKMVFYKTIREMTAGIAFAKEQVHYRIFWLDVGDTGSRWSAESVMLGYPHSGIYEDYELYLKTYKEYGDHSSMAERRNVTP